MNRISFFGIVVVVTDEGTLVCLFEGMLTFPLVRSLVRLCWCSSKPTVARAHTISSCAFLQCRQWLQRVSSPA